MKTTPLLPPMMAQTLWKTLWQVYRRRVVYAREYEAMLAAAGSTIANDHIAFRTLGMGVESPRGVLRLGIAYLEPLIQWLGYEVAGDCLFPERSLYARYYRHPQQDDFDLPKLFVSELLVDELPQSIAAQIHATVNTGQFFSLADWPPYQRKQQQQPAQSTQKQITTSQIKSLAAVFSRPWQPPKKSIVMAVNDISQYGAWVLLHGYAVNHFTGYINHQNTPQYPDIASTVEGLKARGVPMKKHLEGSVSSGLQQITTQAVTALTPVLNDQDYLDEIPWSYAYYELAERHSIVGPSGDQILFEGFIGSQAKHLFEMTRMSHSGA